MCLMDNTMSVFEGYGAFENTDLGLHGLLHYWTLCPNTKVKYGIIFIVHKYDFIIGSHQTWIAYTGKLI